MRSRFPILSLVVVLVTLVLLPGRGVAGDDDFVRWTLLDPAASPYHTIRYEITRRRPATTAIHRRNLPGLEESLHALGLMTQPEADRAFAALRTAQAATLPSTTGARRPGTLRWRCELRLDGKDHRFEVDDPEVQADRRYAAIFWAVRDAVLAHAGELPFRNVFFPAAQRGWINIESVPAAKVFIDGLDTQLETPLYAYEIAAGEHDVRLVSSDGRFDRVYKVRLEAQGTTTLRVDLR